MSLALGAPLELPFAVEALAFWKSLPFEFLLAGHCAFVAGLAPEFKGHWLVHYLVRAPPPPPPPLGRDAAGCLPWERRVC
jgi:hypothetical protein